MQSQQQQQQLPKEETSSSNFSNTTFHASNIGDSIVKTELDTLKDLMHVLVDNSKFLSSFAHSSENDKRAATDRLQRDREFLRAARKYFSNQQVLKLHAMQEFFVPQEFPNAQIHDKKTAEKIASNALQSRLAHSVCYMQKAHQEVDNDLDFADDCDVHSEQFVALSIVVETFLSDAQVRAIISLIQRFPDTLKIYPQTKSYIGYDTNWGEKRFIYPCLKDLWFIETLEDPTEETNPYFRELNNIASNSKDLQERLEIMSVDLCIRLKKACGYQWVAIRTTKRYKDQKEIFMTPEYMKTVLKQKYCLYRIVNCANCFKATDYQPLQRCGGCRLYFFCNAECYKQFCLKTKHLEAPDGCFHYEKLCK